MIVKFQALKLPSFAVVGGKELVHSQEVALGPKIFFEFFASK